MEIVASLIKLFFGSKADKDRKQIEPYLEKIKAVYPSIEALSNDELRDRSEALKKQIADFIAPDEADIVELKAKLELPGNLAGGEGTYLEADRRDDQTHRREDRGETRRDPARSLRHHEGYGTPLRAERRGGRHGQRFRPGSGRREGLRPYRGR